MPSTSSLSIGTFVREQRHIFGVCPHCQTVRRLADIQIAYKKPYVEDWMDLTDEQAQKWEEKKAELKEQEKQLRDEAADYAKRKLLPAKLKAISTMFAKQKLNPQDVKVLLHPVDFLAFDGMNLKDRVDQVLFLDKVHKSQLHKQIQDSLQDVIEAEKYEWATVRIDENGKVFVEP